ncbi:MAG TPA: hypothetical protein VFU31_28415 [Candidatus Binatia bacterium]|nr:hypothetical protein [Candidatus Binatia bacterium]
MRVKLQTTNQEAKRNPPRAETMCSALLPSAVAAPSLLVAGTDSRHYANLTRNIFRFVPITIGPKDAARFHGIDERIALGDYERCIRFYVQLIRNAAG